MKIKHRSILRVGISYIKRYIVDTYTQPNTTMFHMIRYYILFWFSYITRYYDRFHCNIVAMHYLYNLILYQSSQLIKQQKDQKYHFLGRQQIIYKSLELVPDICHTLYFVEEIYCIYKFLTIFYDEVNPKTADPHEMYEIVSLLLCV